MKFLAENNSVFKRRIEAYKKIYILWLTVNICLAIYSPNTNSENILSDKHIQEEIVKANNGDSEAAYRISQYYLNSQQKSSDDITKTSRFWLRKAASMRHFTAIGAIGYAVPYSHKASAVCGDMRIVLVSNYEYLDETNQQPVCAKQTLSFYNKNDKRIKNYNIDFSKQIGGESYFRVNRFECLESKKNKDFYLILHLYDPSAFVSELKDGNIYYHQSNYVGSDNSNQKKILKNYYRKVTSHITKEVDSSKYNRQTYTLDIYPSLEETKKYFGN